MKKDCRRRSVKRLEAQTSYALHCCCVPESEPDGWLIMDNEGGRTFISHPAGSPASTVKDRLERLRLQVLGAVVFRRWK